MEKSQIGTAAARALLGSACFVVLGVVLAGCTGQTAVPMPLPSPSGSTSPSESSAPTPPADPALLPDGTAEDNLPYFNLVNSRFLAAGLTPGGRPIIDNLVAAGFDKATMQVSQDATTIGRAVDSLQFSVRFGDRCLIGQTSAAGYVGLAGPVASEATCLIGKTRAIDW